MNIVTDVILPLALAFIMFVLGLGLTGKTFSMVPNKLRVKSTYVKSNKIFNRKLNIHSEENTQPNKQKVNPQLLVNNNIATKKKIVFIFINLLLYNL